MSFEWTDEKIQTVKDLWGKQSANEIAGIIGHPSRNAVCGKAHRLGLSNGHKPATQEELKAEVLIDDLGQVWPEGISLMELTSETCRFPLWGGVISDQYCGAKSIEGCPYCGFHSRIAYQRRGQ